MSLFKEEIKDSPEVQERVRRWIVALRSGAYKQGKDMLRKGQEFCCLGVACDLYDPEGWAGGGNEIGSSFHRTGYIALPSDAREYFMITDAEGLYREQSDKHTFTSLAGANDHGRSFKQIATIIEKELAKWVTQ